MRTGFFADERLFWHGGGNYSFLLPVEGLVQPGAGLPESPEGKRRLRNLLEVTGLIETLAQPRATAASWEDLARVHSTEYLTAFKAASDQGGGEIGLRAPFGKGGFELAALSAGLATSALDAVLRGELRNAYALSRPPGHHATQDWPNGFCLINNIAVAIRAAQAKGLAGRIAVVDWDVHHGNGTEAIFYDDPSVLTISLHQERNYPLDTGGAEDRGTGAGLGYNLNIPLPPGTGHHGYLRAFNQIVAPALRRFKPEAIVVACGFDASGVDPLGRMLLHAESFQMLTQEVMALADELCQGRLVMVHEGGYSETHVPFCGHAVIATLASSDITAPDPFFKRISGQQPGPAFEAFIADQIDSLTQRYGF